MKLTVKTSILYLLIIIPMIAVAGYVCYSSITQSVNENVDEELWREKLNAETIIRKNDTLSKFNFGKSYIYSIKRLEKGTGFKYKFADFSVYDSLEKEQLPYRNITSVYSYKGRHYLISVSKPQIESDDLIESIVYSMVVLMTCLLVCLFLLNWFISRSVWRPFYKTLEQLKLFQLNHAKAIEFDKVSTHEFNALNDSLSQMTKALVADYKTQKQFTENASHEIQTPLAVIQSKLELLIQSQKLDANDMQLIESVYMATIKLSQLNKGLILLTKIENNQFHENNHTNLKTVIEGCLSNLSEFCEAKKIKLAKNLEDEMVNMHPMLCDILVNNLLQNAIKHNVHGGKITVYLGAKQLVISNTGNEIKGDAGKIFERFTKFTDNSDSIGLGLSIVKSICEKYGFKLSYQFLHNLHTVSINL
jgi:signal transduction histidine kinase